MHAWLLLESIGEMILLKNRDDLLQSVRISYSTCLDITIEQLPSVNPAIIAFKVTGRRKNPDLAKDDIGASLFESFDHTVQFQRISIYEEPTHL
jgi:hypothetical protein